MRASNEDEDEGLVNIQEQIAESVREMTELKAESKLNLQSLHAELETAKQSVTDQTELQELEDLKKDIMSDSNKTSQTDTSL